MACIILLIEYFSASYQLCLTPDESRQMCGSRAVPFRDRKAPFAVLEFIAIGYQHCYPILHLEA